MKFSVITPTFNAAQHIERNIRSVVAQEVAELQHLIIDNCSTDGTLDIVKACNSPFVRIVSEKDNGIYDAFNKGIALATGEVIATLNADDFYLDGALNAVVDAFTAHPDVACVHGNIRVERNGTPVTLRPRSGIFSYGGARVFHPAFFCRRRVFEKIGNFDTRYPVAADFDFMLRARKQFPFFHLDRPLTHFSLGGFSTRRRFQSSHEVRAIARSQGFGAVRTTLVWLLEMGIKSIGSLRS